jgi:fatty-acyl-CoA synthase/long-chain acyl-CoA synthetase
MARETSDVATLESAGQPCLMAEIKVVYEETGDKIPRGDVGEILATAPYAMEEYFERPEKTAATLVDGWVPDIRKVAVIGIPHPDWDEAVHAVVVPALSSLSTAEIKAFADDQLAEYKKPKSVEFGDGIPKTSLRETGQSCTPRSTLGRRKQRHRLRAVTHVEETISIELLRARPFS